jgi:phosphate transport system substrate-binding protein
MIKVICVAGFAALFLFGTTLFASAQDITLTSRDSKVELSGTLRGFDGEFYRVQTEYGELTIDGSGVLCAGPGCPDLEGFVAELQISGAPTLGSVVMPALIEAFAQKNDYLTERKEGADATSFVYLLRRVSDGNLAARFYFRVTNTDEGFADLLADEADIVMSLREIRPDERSRAREVGLGDMTGPNRSRVLALDAIVPVVSGSNPVRGISPDDLAQVLAGKIINWRSLGGPDVPVSLHLPDDVSGLGQAIEDQLLRPANLNEFSGKAIRHTTPSALASAVADDTFALGLTSYADRGDTQALMLTGACGFSMEASRRTIKTEDYPLTAPMFLYFPARRLPQIVREFLAFTRGPAAQIVIRRSGFVDQTPEEIEVEQQGNRFANAIAHAGTEINLGELQRMTATLTPMARLSTSFRFEAGSIRLDAQSRSNVQQLARALEVGQYDARRLLFVGFSDGNGAADANRDIALRRADAVRRAVTEAAVTANLERVELGVDAFGEAMPMACDDSSWGRRANRRVEVWVR